MVRSKTGVLKFSLRASSSSIHYVWGKWEAPVRLWEYTGLPEPMQFTCAILIWAASWQNQQNGMCAQRRLRSAWASTHSDHSLRCPHEESLDPLSTRWRLWSDWVDAQADRQIWVFVGCTVIFLVLSWGVSFYQFQRVPKWFYSHSWRLHQGSYTVFLCGNVTESHR